MNTNGSLGRRQNTGIVKISKIGYFFLKILDKMLEKWQSLNSKR